MDQRTQVAAAEALNATLCQFEALGGLRLQSVWEVRDGRSLDQVAFQFEEHTLKVGCEAKDDSIEIGVWPATEP